MVKNRNHQISARLPVELVREFEEVAKMQGYTRQEALIKAMQQWIDKH